MGPVNDGALILEIGSRDCLDAVELYQQFVPEAVYAFEPSKPGMRRCLDVLADFPDIAPSVMLCGFALGDMSGTTTLYEFTLKETASGSVNIGASSLFPWTSRHHSDDDPVKGIEDQVAVQRHYPVPVFRADALSFLKNRDILLIAMDVEGAELAVLEGAEALLPHVRYLCLEAGYHLPREGGVADGCAVVDYLVARNWELVLCKGTGQAVLPEDPGHLTQFDLLFRNKAFQHSAGQTPRPHPQSP